MSVADVHEEKAVKPKTGIFWLHQRKKIGQTVIVALLFASLINDQWGYDYHQSRSEKAERHSEMIAAACV